ncbi:MAG: glycosyltransferase family 87 protein [Methylacidiphilales bacterium]|nr:glycosyltransferase family 87 protein [Candidatus Methylacidiphilales bacterium]
MPQESTPTATGTVTLQWRRPLSLLARFWALLAFVLFFGIVGANYWLGHGPTWKWGGLKAGDLSQHYAGGIFWKKGWVQPLYRDYKLGDWMNDWNKSVDPKQGKTKMERFNYVYSPLIAKIASWFTGYSYGTWVSFWFYSSFALYAFCGWLLYRSDPHPGYLAVLPLLWFAGFHSFYYTLIPGQNTVITLAILLAAGHLLNLRRDWAAGFVMSLTFYKPQLMPYIGFFMLLTGNWRFCMALALGGIFWIFGVGILATGWEANRLWFESLQDMAAGRQFQKPGLNQSWRGFLPGIIPVKNWAEALPLLFSLATVTLSPLWLRVGEKKIEWKPAYALYIAAVAWILASPYVGHYELLLGLPWWMTLLVRFQWRWSEILLLSLYWCVGVVALLGLRMQFSLSAPLLALWLFGSLYLTVNWPTQSQKSAFRKKD